MGFPVGYTEVFIPTLFLHTLTFFTFIRKFLFNFFNFFNYFGLSDFLEPGPMAPIEPLPARITTSTTTPSPSLGPPPLSAILTRELLPLVHVSKEQEENESCAVCLYEFISGEEIRWLGNCKHIFHKDCLDRWMDLDHRTCPLCRTPFLLDDLLDQFNQRFLAADADDSCDLLQYVDHFNYTGF